MADIAPLGGKNNSNCTLPAIDDFPSGFFTREQRENGAIAVHVIVSLYLFAALAVVCDRYFVPAVDRICHALKMSNDVAGATFMAAATSAPELFVNVIGTFITEGDIGLGTIVGSAVFNILAVAACCGISAKMVVPLDWWPVTRDCFAYGITVIILISIIHDERVEWYEALVLVVLYAIYICIMYFDKSIQKCVRGNVDEKNGDHQMQNGDLKNDAAIANIESDGDILPEKPKVEKKLEIPNKIEVTEKNATMDSIEEKEENDDVPEDEYRHSLWKYPFKQDCFTQMTWVVTWPINLVFWFTIPDCENPRCEKWYPLTFIMCIVWIGSLSYAVAWMITIIGDTLRIPDSVMGITFLAAGTSVPEAVSSVIVAKQGHGSMGISNSIGSNTFDILLCLGLPWFIKASFRPTKADEHVVSIISAGLVYSAISLLSTLFLLYLTFWCNNFKLDKKVGYICLCMYVVFLVLATLIELNVFFQVNLPMCNR